MFDEFKKEFFYAGEFAKQLDEKRRVSFPTKWRFAGDEDDNSYLAIVQDDEYISILPPKEMALMREKISQVSKKNKVKQTAIRKMMKDSYTFGCDKHGRIMFTEAVLKRVGIDKRYASSATATLLKSGIPRSTNRLPRERPRLKTRTLTMTKSSKRWASKSDKHPAHENFLHYPDKPNNQMDAARRPQHQQSSRTRNLKCQHQMTTER